MVESKCYIMVCGEQSVMIVLMTDLALLSVDNSDTGRSSVTASLNPFDHNKLYSVAITAIVSV